jgi:hypothetical protein
MKVRSLSTDDLRKVCRTLVETDGDVIVTAQTHGLPPEFVKKIKKGEYLPSVTSSFFSPDRWRDPVPGCTEPDPVQLTIDEEPKEEKEMSVEPTTKINRRQGTPEATVRRICERLCEGTYLNKEIAKEVGVSENVVSMIKIKKRYTDISDKYFTYINDHQYKVMKTGKIVDINARSLALMKTTPLTTVEKKTKVNALPVPTTTETISLTVETSNENDIITEIINLATKVVGSKKISELPEHMQVKVLEAIKSDIENMSLKEIKELCQ